MPSCDFKKDRKCYIITPVWDLNYESISEIKAKLDGGSLAMSKKFGQNFLLSRSVRERIVGEMGLLAGRAVWEIGPGLGAITSLMLARGAMLTCFEIDHGFAEILSGEAFGDEKNFSLVEGDALRTIPPREDVPDIICGNLPYNVGSQIIASIIEKGRLPERMVFTLQKEVVDRMTSRPGEKDYSSFSVLTQLDYVNRCAFQIGRRNFYPEPNVDSAVVVMQRKIDSPLSGQERSEFLSLVRVLFAQRRKTVRNNLATRLGKDEISRVLEYSGIDGTSRAEALSFDELLALAAAERRIKAK